MLVKSKPVPRSEKQITATICQVNNKAESWGINNYFSHGVKSSFWLRSIRVESRIHTDFLRFEKWINMKLNDIGKGESSNWQSRFMSDSYINNKSNGSLFLIVRAVFEYRKVGNLRRKIEKRD